MMIRLKDQMTREEIASFGDNEVQPAIKAARAAGKIVNMDLLETKDIEIYILREETRECLASL